MDNQNDRDNAVALDIFKQAGALLKGHFKLTSGLHSDTYMEKCMVLQYPDLTDKLCAMLAARFAADNVQVVIGPAVGAIIIAHDVARHLGARSIFCERENGRMVLRRGFTIAPGERVLAVEDVVTTGGSVQEVIDLVNEGPGQLVGMGYFVDRSGGKASFATRTEYLIKQDVPTWQPEACPLCQAGIPMTSRGSRHI